MLTLNFGVQMLLRVFQLSYTLHVSAKRILFKSMACKGENKRLRNIKSIFFIGNVIRGCTEIRRCMDLMTEFVSICVSSKYLEKFFFFQYLICWENELFLR